MAPLNRSVVDHPWLTIALFAAVTAFLAVRIPELHIEPDVRTMMASHHPEFLYNEWMEEYFAIADPAVLLVVNDGEHGVFTPETLAAEIRKHIPEFIIKYDVDPVRQAIADSWPASIDDSTAREEWDWAPSYDLETMTTDMLENLRKKIG